MLPYSGTFLLGKFEGELRKKSSKECLLDVLQLEKQDVAVLVLNGRHLQLEAKQELPDQVSQLE